MTGRLRFHVRWARRLLVREPARHALIVAVLAAATMALTFVAALLWHATRPPVASIGPAAYELILADAGRQTLGAGLRAVEEAGLDAVVVREEPAVFPGAASQLPLRDQPLEGAFGGRPFTILAGRLPRGPRELAVTPVSLEALEHLIGPRTGLGARVRVTAGPPLTIVGVVRDPRNHGSGAMFVDESVRLAASSASVYTTAPLPRLIAFQEENESVHLLAPLSEGASDGVVALALVLGGGMLIVAGLLAAITYALSARRRLREYGMLAAIGASSRQIGATITAVGLVTGVVAAVPGALGGWVLALAGRSWLQDLLGRDLAADGAPTWIAVAPMALVVCVSTVAARRPARAIARMAVVDALTGRPPRRSRSGRSARLAPVALLLAAFAFMAGASSDRPLLLFCGPLLTLVAVLLIAPILVRWVGRGSSFGPTAWRFALRDIARRPGSSAALLAGMTVLLAVPASVAVLAASAERQRAESPPNLPANMLLLEETVGGLGGFSAVKPDRAGAAAVLRRLRARLPDARTTAVRVPVAGATHANRAEHGPRHPVYETVWAVQRRLRPPRLRGDAPVWIATPDLLAAVTPRGRASGPVPAVLSDNPERIGFREPTGDAGGEHRAAPLRAPPSELLAGVWIAPAFARRHGWRAHTAGWLLVDDRPIPASVVRAAAADAYPDFEVVGNDSGSAAPFPVRLVLLAACLAALALALAVLALERLEVERDLQVLTAVGARKRLLAQMIGTRTAVLTVVAALSAIVVGYAVWLANRLFSADEPPIAVSADLLLVAVALPLVLGAVSAVVRMPRPR